MAELAYRDIVRYLSGEAVRPDGIVAASDVIAMTALRALSEVGLSVPGDVRVVGYDNLPLSELTVPSLTTIGQNMVAGAEHLVDMLMRRVAGEDTRSFVMKPELVERMSA